MPTSPGHRLWRVLTAAVCLTIILVVAGCSSGSAPSEVRATKLRLVSLSPGVTATVAALGGASSLVAVSDYCELPKGMNELPRVGSALTLNVEKLASLNQAGGLTIVGPKMQLQWSDVLHKLGTARVLPWSTPAELVESTLILGSLLGQEAAAKGLARHLEVALPEAGPASGARVALILDAGEAFDGTFWFVKPNSIHGAALHGAGYRNAFPDAVKGPPQVSAEQLIAVDPDIVLLISNREIDMPSRRRILGQFEALTPLTAVRTGAVDVLGYEGALVEGPGVVTFAARLRGALGALGAAAPKEAR